MKFSPLALSATLLIAVNLWWGNPVGFVGADVASVSDSVPVPEAATSAEKFEFQAEVHKVLDIVVNSLYTNKDVFLRELISNASDALDKVRFLSITKPELLDGKKELEIRISYDAESNSLTISDSGIGMTKEELIQNLGTVARSGTTKFMQSMKESSGDINQIGMFGVGFYSAFLVADKVRVASKHPNDPVQHVWESSNGSSSFTVAEDSRGNTLSRGTEITLSLKDDASEYLNDEKLKQLVHHYSEFITHPIFLLTTVKTQVPDENEIIDLEKSEDSEKDEFDSEDSTETSKTPKMKDVVSQSWNKVNAEGAIWTRPKDEISDEEYQSFYREVISKSGTNATTWSHFDAEGNINFKSLVYLPDEIPFELRQGNFDGIKNGMKLYVRRVLISDSFELLPRYMSMVKGVVDSDDLPLNVNRETLQESKIITIIRKKVVRKVLDLISKFAGEDGASVDDASKEVEIDAEGNVIDNKKSSKDASKSPYASWFEKFGPSLKMGIIDDPANQKRITKLLRFNSNKETFIGIDDYVARMKDWQKQIYYIAGQKQSDLETSPFMEKFVEKDVEVLYLTDPADEYVMQHLRDWEGKKLISITTENVSLDDGDKDKAQRLKTTYEEKFKPLVKFFNQFYTPHVMSVKVSQRLGSSPAIVSSGEYGASANQAKILSYQAFKHGGPDYSAQSFKTLEINPRHPFIVKLLSDIPSDVNSVPLDLKDTLWNLLDMALVSGGYDIRDPKSYAKRMMRTIQDDLDVDSMTLEPEIDVPVKEKDDIELGENDGINVHDFEDLD